MSFDLQREVLAFDPAVPIAEAWMPPSSWYTSAEFLALEQRAVFSPAWHPLARVEQLQEAGSYVSGCSFGEPWVLVRDLDGSLRGFFNTCRHKGREVVLGAGRADELVCGYHAWTYGLDGTLRRAPRVAGIQGFDRGEMSLRPLRIESWGPWVFGNLDGRAPPLRERLAELDRRLEATEWTKLHFVDRRSWTIECNWKVYADNYLDGGYHIPHMHPSLDAQIEMDTYRTDCFGEFSIQSAEPRADEDARIDFDADARIGPGAIYAWIHPNLTLNRYGPCLDSNYIVPRGPTRCEVVYEFYFEEVDGEEARRFIAESIAQSDVTQREDIAICESVQVGLGSSSYDRGRYAPQVEIGEHHFHRLLARDYRRTLGSSG